MPGNPEKTIPTWQKGLAGCLLVLVVLGITLGWSRFLSDFYPPDRSFVGPNLIASVVQWAVILIAVALVYPPARRAVARYIEHHVKDIKNHVTAEHAAVHDKLDHIIKHSKDVPPFPK